MIGTRKREDVLVQPIERLEEALHNDFPGREVEWAEAVSNSLGNVEQAVRLHTSSAEAPDGLLAQADLTRPTLARQVSQLRQEHQDLITRAGTLQERLRDAAKAFRTPGKEIALANPLPEPPGPAVVQDLGTIRQETERLVQALHHHSDDESQLILESVNRDTGVGD